jgi:hypothetical protein
MKKNILPALIRGLRAAVAFGLPYLLSWLAKNPNPKLVALGPVLMAIGKFLRDTYKWEWLPI